jgi:hypothetical protein
MAAKVQAGDPWFSIGKDGRSCMLIQAHTWYDARERAHKEYGDDAYCEPISNELVKGWEAKSSWSVASVNGKGNQGSWDNCEAIPGGPKDSCKS